MAEEHHPGIALSDAAALMIAAPTGRLELGVVFCRELEIARDGTCVPLDGPVPITCDQVYAEDQAFPEIARPGPLVRETDLLPFRTATDLVVQGRAHTYGGGTRTTVEVHLPGWSRAVRVTGDRRCVWTGSRLEFTEPVPFESLPVRADRAFGGFDSEGFEAFGDPAAKALAKLHPELGTGDATRWHAPRNGFGLGFHAGGDPARLDGAPVPNLDFEFDPVEPARMHVARPELWPTTPLPAFFDWLEQASFPRIAYIGQTPPAEGLAGAVEIGQRWCGDELLAEHSPVRPDLRFVQGAQPGMSFGSFRGGMEIGLVNLVADAPTLRVRTSRDVPKVTVGGGVHGSWKPAPRLVALEIRADERRVREVWGARTPVRQPYAPAQLAQFHVEILWPGRKRS